ALACDPADILPKVFAAAEFTGKFAATVEALAPQGPGYDRLAAIGLGKAGELDEYAWVKIGGLVQATAKSASEVTVVVEAEGVTAGAREAASIGLGIMLRSYKFDKYKTRKDENGKPAASKPAKITIQCADPTAAKKAYAEQEAVGEGVIIARDLVNEPANILGPVEFAAQAKELEKLGVKVEILTEREMKRLGMGALLGVSQGSVRPPRLVVMQWMNGKAKQKPVAFVGKGVVFDTGGISIKPAGGMEDMKGDMA